MIKLHMHIFAWGFFLCCCCRRQYIRFCLFAVLASWLEQVLLCKIITWYCRSRRGETRGISKCCFISSHSVLVVPFTESKNLGFTKERTAQRDGVKLSQNTLLTSHFECCLKKKCSTVVGSHFHRPSFSFFRCEKNSRCHHILLPLHVDISSFYCQDHGGIRFFLYFSRKDWGKKERKKTKTLKNKNIAIPCCAGSWTFFSLFCKRLEMGRKENLRRADPARQLPEMCHVVRLVSTLISVKHLVGEQRSFSEPTSALEACSVNVSTR